MTAYKLEELFPQELQARLDSQPILVLSFGTIEWHSHHLPLGLDGLVAAHAAERIADGADAVLAPVSYWASGGVPYPYTLRLPVDVVEPLLVSVFSQFAEMGFRVIVAYTGHYNIDQTLTIKRAALKVMETTPVSILALTGYDLTTDAGYKGDHASTGETSMMQALRPDLVRMNSIPPNQRLDGLTGPDPRGMATAEHGKAILDKTAQRGAEVALRLLHRTDQLQRATFVDSQRAMVRVLAKIADQQQSLPRAQIANVTTPAYLAYCQAIYVGDYAAARRHAEEKLGDLAR